MMIPSLAPAAGPMLFVILFQAITRSSSIHLSSSIRFTSARYWSTADEGVMNCQVRAMAGWVWLNRATWCWVGTCEVRIQSNPAPTIRPKDWRSVLSRYVRPGGFGIELVKGGPRGVSPASSFGLMNPSDMQLGSSITDESVYLTISR